jgi:vacuolar iron transporter family protein
VGNHTESSADTFVDPAWAASFAMRRMDDPEKFSTEPRTSSEASEATVVDRKPTTTHFKIDARVISDAIIGLSDGLTVPFALTAGLSALGDTKVVVYGGLAELCAGAISMGLGGYLGAKSEE